ncbi:MAG: hypothetical protein WCF06_08930 [Nitrososphaeraceae archaeon]
MTLGFCNGLELRVIPPWVGKLVNRLHVITCKKCSYISTEKLPESKAKEMVRSHLGGPQNCTRGHVNGESPGLIVVE